MKSKYKQNMIKRSRAGVKGLIISWLDKDPLRDTAETIAGTVTHRNPVFRLTARKIFQDFGEWITDRQAFRWLVTIKIIFDYPNGTRQIEERELEAVSTIKNLNEHCLDAIRDAMRHGNKEYYKHTEFTIECLEA